MTNEELRVIHLNQDGRVIGMKTYVGNAHAVALPITGIIAEALRNKTCAMIVSHTHPGGDPTPSRADIHATRKLAIALRACGVRLHDHIVQAPEKSLSFRELGLL